MTLDEYMKTAEGIVQIGAKVGFFFFGDMNDYEKMIDDISDTYYRKNKQSVKNAKWNLNSINARLASGVEDRSLLVKKKSYEKLLDECMQRDRSFFDLRKRKVIDIYKATITNATIVIIGGTEVGGYWDIYEWNQVHGIPCEEHNKFGAIDEESANELVNSIVLTAVDDYKKLLMYDYGLEHKENIKGSLNQGTYHNYKELEKFFGGSWFGFLMPNTNGAETMRKVKEKTLTIDIPEMPRLKVKHPRAGWSVYQAYNGHVYVKGSRDELINDFWSSKRLSKGELRVILRKSMNDAKKKNKEVA